MGILDSLPSEVNGSKGILGSLPNQGTPSPSGILDNLPSQSSQGPKYVGIQRARVPFKPGGKPSGNILTDIGGGLASVVPGYIGMGGSLAQLIGDAINNENLSEFGKDVAQWGQDASSKLVNPAVVSSWKTHPFRKTAAIAGQGIGWIAPMLFGGWTVKAATAPLVARKLMTDAAQKAVVKASMAGALAIPAGAATYTEAREAGVPEGRAMGMAGGSALQQFLIESYVPFTNKMKFFRGNEIARRIAKNATQEGLEEVFQQGFDNLIKATNWQTDESFMKRMREGLLEGFVGGAVAGGVTGKYFGGPTWEEAAYDVWRKAEESRKAGKPVVDPVTGKPVNFKDVQDAIGITKDSYTQRAKDLREALFNGVISTAMEDSGLIKGTRVIYDPAADKAHRSAIFDYPMTHDERVLIENMIQRRLIDKGVKTYPHNIQVNFLDDNHLNEAVRSTFVNGIFSFMKSDPTMTQEAVNYRIDSELDQLLRANVFYTEGTGKSGEAGALVDPDMKGFFAGTPDNPIWSKISLRELGSFLAAKGIDPNSVRIVMNELKGETKAEGQVKKISEVLAMEVKNSKIKPGDPLPEEFGIEPGSPSSSDPKVLAERTKAIYEAILNSKLPAFIKNFAMKLVVVVDEIVPGKNLMMYGRGKLAQKGITERSVELFMKTEGIREDDIKSREHLSEIIKSRMIQLVTKVGDTIKDRANNIIETDPQFYPDEAKDRLVSWGFALERKVNSQNIHDQLFAYFMLQGAMRSLLDPKVRMPNILPVVDTALLETEQYFADNPGHGRLDKVYRANGVRLLTEGKERRPDPRNPNDTETRFWVILKEGDDLAFQFLSPGRWCTREQNRAKGYLKGKTQHIFVVNNIAEVSIQLGYTGSFGETDVTGLNNLTRQVSTIDYYDDVVAYIDSYIPEKKDRILKTTKMANSLTLKKAGATDRNYIQHWDVIDAGAERRERQTYEERQRNALFDALDDAMDNQGFLTEYEDIEPVLRRLIGDDENTIRQFNIAYTVYRRFNHFPNAVDIYNQWRVQRVGVYPPLMERDAFFNIQNKVKIIQGSFDLRSKYRSVNNKWNAALNGNRYQKQEEALEPYSSIGFGGRRSIPAYTPTREEKNVLLDQLIEEISQGGDLVQRNNLAYTLDMQRKGTILAAIDNVFLSNFKDEYGYKYDLTLDDFETLEEFKQSFFDERNKKYASILKSWQDVQLPTGVLTEAGLPTQYYYGNISTEQLIGIEHLDSQFIQTDLVKDFQSAILEEYPEMTLDYIRYYKSEAKGGLFNPELDIPGKKTRVRKHPYYEYRIQKVGDKYNIQKRWKSRQAYDRLVKKRAASYFATEPYSREWVDQEDIRGFNSSKDARRYLTMLNQPPMNRRQRQASFTKINRILNYRAGVQERYYSKSKDDILAAYDPVNNRILIRSDIDPKDVPRKILHEIFHRGHIYLTETFGQQASDDLYNILEEAYPKLKEKSGELLANHTGYGSLEEYIESYGMDINTKEGKFKLYLELAALWSETFADEEPETWWGKMLRDIAEWIRKFVGIDMTEYDVDELISGFLHYGALAPEMEIREDLAGYEARGIPAEDRDRVPEYNDNLKEKLDDQTPEDSPDQETFELDLTDDQNFRAYTVNERVKMELENYVNVLGEYEKQVNLLKTPDTERIVLTDMEKSAKRNKLERQMDLAKAEDKLARKIDERDALIRAQAALEPTMEALRKQRQNLTARKLADPGNPMVKQELTGVLENITRLSFEHTAYKDKIRRAYGQVTRVKNEIIKLNASLRMYGKEVNREALEIYYHLLNLEKTAAYQALSSPAKLYVNGKSYEELASRLGMLQVKEDDEIAREMVKSIGEGKEADELMALQRALEIDQPTMQYNGITFNAPHLVIDTQGNQRTVSGSYAFFNKVYEGKDTGHVTLKNKAGESFDINVNELRRIIKASIDSPGVIDWDQKNYWFSKGKTTSIFKELQNMRGKLVADSFDQYLVYRKPAMRWVLSTIQFFRGDVDGFKRWLAGWVGSKKADELFEKETVKDLKNMRVELKKAEKAGVITAREKEQSLYTIDKVIQDLFADKNYGKFVSVMAYAQVKPVYDKIWQIIQEDHPGISKVDAQELMNRISKYMSDANQEWYSSFDGNNVKYEITNAGKLWQFANVYAKEDVDRASQQFVQRVQAFLQDFGIIMRNPDGSIMWLADEGEIRDLLEIPSNVDIWAYLSENHPKLIFTRLLQHPNVSKNRTAITNTLMLAKAQLETPLLERQIELNVFDTTDIIANIYDGYSHRVWKMKGVQDVSGGAVTQNPFSGPNTPAAKYKMYFEFVYQTENQKLEAIDNYFSALQDYLQDSMMIIKQVQTLDGFKQLALPIDTRFRFVMYENSPEVIARQDEIEKATGKRPEANAILFDLGYRQAKTAPGLATWYRGAFMNPYIHNSVADVIENLWQQRTGKTDSIAAHISRGLRWIKIFQTINPYDSTFIWMSGVLMNLRSPVALITDVGKPWVKSVKKGISGEIAKKMWKGEYEPMENIEDIPNIELFLKHGLSVANWSSYMNTLYDKEALGKFPQSLSKFENVLNIVESVGGTNAAIFDGLISPAIAKVTNQWFERFMAESDPNMPIEEARDQAARRAVHLMNDLSLLVNKNIFGREAEFANIIFFTRQLTYGFLRLLTGALHNGIRAIGADALSDRLYGFDATKGKNPIDLLNTNVLFHGEKSRADMDFLASFYAWHLTKIFIVGTLINAGLQYALSFWDDDEEDEHGEVANGNPFASKRWIWNNEPGKRSAVRLPFKDVNQRRNFIDFQMLRENKQMYDVLGGYVSKNWGIGSRQWFMNRLGVWFQIFRSQVMNMDFNGEPLIDPDMPEDLQTRKRVKELLDILTPFGFPVGAQAPMMEDAKINAALVATGLIGATTRKGKAMEGGVTWKDLQETREAAAKRKAQTADIKEKLRGTPAAKIFEQKGIDKLTPDQLRYLFMKKTMPGRQYLKANRRSLMMMKSEEE